MQALTQSLKYRQWVAALAQNGTTLHHLEERFTYRKPNGEVLFALIEAQATSAEGNPLLPLLLLRGRFVMAVVELVLTTSGERFLVLVAQHRLATGGLFYSHPAGMADSEADLKQVVVKEVWEETGLSITLDQVAPLAQGPYYTSDGILDEAGEFFLVSLPITPEALEGLQGRRTGAPDEPEFIHLHIVSPAQAQSLIRNIAGHLCTHLYLNLRSA